ncbi:oligosaccharide flippase family protein [Lacrimispora saccharolytica]|nr:oligosaccharide flippase family protein [Lacrimispora saccharolytica]
MQRLERTKNSVRNLAWGIVNKGVSMFLPFLIRVVIIEILGKEYLGLNNLFTSILQTLNLAELGIGSAMVYSMYKPIAEDNEDLICSLLALYKKLYRIIGFVVFGIGVVLIPFLPYLIKGGVDGINVNVLYMIFLVDTVLSYFLFAYKNSLLIAHQRTDVNSNIGTIIHLLLNLTQVILLFAFKNYYAYIIVKPVFTIANNLLVNRATNRMYPRYKPRGMVSKEKQREIFSRVKALVGHKIGTTVVSSADSLVISAFLGLNILAIYSNYYYIIYFIVSLTSIFFNGMLAGIGNSLVVETNDKNYTLFENINFILSWLVSWCSTCLLCLLQPFMELWMGKDMLLSTSSLICIVIYYYSWQFRTTGLYFKDAAGMWRADFWKPYVSSIFNIVVNIILVQIMGINGVFISTIVCMIGINFLWETIVLFRDLFKRSPAKYIGKEVLALLKTVVMCVTTYFTCLALPMQHGVSCIIFRFLICLILPNIIFIMSSYKMKEFSYAMGKVKQILQKRL